MIDAVEARPAGFGARLRAWWSVGLAVHAALLAVILVLLVPVVGTQASYSVDEGSMILQVRALAEQHSWGVPHPLPAADPTGIAFPLQYAEPSPEGFMPFAKHPLYPEILAPAERAGGIAGMVLVSVAGTVLAAIAAALIARRLAPGLDRATLWVTGLASPLLFDSQTIFAHSLAAAAAGFAVLGALWLLEGRRRAIATAGTVAAVGVCVLLRAEGLLFAIALALALAATGLLRRQGRLLMSSGLVVGAAYVALKAETRWFEHLAGKTEPGTAVGHTGSTGFVTGRVQGFVHTMLQSDGGPLAVVALLLMLTALVLVAWTVRRTPADRGAITMFSAVAVTAAVGRLVLAPPDMVSGLAVAFPLLIVAIVLARRDDFASAASRMVGATIVLFWLAVLATQYPEGGTIEWGGRYFALALPAAVPLALAVLRRSAKTLPPPARSAWLGALAVCSVGLAVLAVSALREGHRQTAAFEAAVDRVSAAAVAGDGDQRPVIVTAEQLAPRLAWATFDRQRWLLVDRTTPEMRDRQLAVVRDLPEVGVKSFVFVTPDLPRDHWLLDPAWRLDEPLGPNGFEGWRIIVVTTA